MKSTLKVKLYDFRKQLPIEMNEVASIISEHINYTDTHSEKEIYGSLRNMLGQHTYSDDVKTLLESIDNVLSDEPLLYALKDVYYKLARKHDRFLYEPIMNTVIECINSESEDERKMKIINDLKIYEWVEEVNNLLFNITENPQLRTNLTSVGGLVEDVYSVLIESENGYLTFIDKEWYLLNEKGVTQTLLEYHIKDTPTLKRLRLLEETIKVAKFDEHSITFEVAQDFNIVLKTDENKIYINDNVKEVETTLETLFNSPVVPFESKGFYPVISETFTNLDKFANITAAKYVWNPTNTAFESIVFNFEGKFYQKRNGRSGSNFLKFENALPLIESIKQELGADITYFFEDVLTDEIKNKIKLEDQIKELTESINKIEESIYLIKEEKEILEEEESVKKLYQSLLVRKHKLTEKLKVTKNKYYEF